MSIFRHFKTVFWVSFIVGALFSVVGCSGDENVVRIEINDRTVKDISIRQFECIQPETTPQSLLYTINSVEPYRSGYLVAGRERLMYFDGDGRFVSQVGIKGRGPGEYLDFSSYYVMQDTVYVYSSQSKKIFKYGFMNDGFVYASTIDLPTSMHANRIIQNSIYPGRYFVNNTYFGIGGEIPNISIYDENFNLIVNSVSRIKDGGMSLAHPFGSNECGIMFTEYMSYAIVKLNSDGVDESMRYNFGSMI